MKFFGSNVSHVTIFTFLPSRYAITVWYFDKHERAMFRKKQEEDQAIRKANINLQVRKTSVM